MWFVFSKCISIIQGELEYASEALPKRSGLAPLVSGGECQKIGYLALND